MYVYHILPVNSRGYYKFQVEIGAATNWNFNIEIGVKHKFMVFKLELRDDYSSAATIWGAAINR